jgi:hypothetical protein
MAGQAWVCATVGSAKAASNHCRVRSLNESSGIRSASVAMRTCGLQVALELEAVVGPANFSN